MKPATQLFRVALPSRIANAMDRMPDKCWRLWLATPDYVHGTFLLFYDDGKIERIVVRKEEGDEVFTVRESDNAR